MPILRRLDEIICVNTSGRKKTTKPYKESTTLFFHIPYIAGRIFVTIFESKPALMPTPRDARKYLSQIWNQIRPRGSRISQWKINLGTCQEITFTYMNFISAASPDVTKERLVGGLSHLYVGDCLADSLRFGVPQKCFVSALEKSELLMYISLYVIYCNRKLPQ